MVKGGIYINFKMLLDDGRSELWQWDTGRTLTVDADCSQVHFSNKVFGRSIDVDVTNGVAIIPDVLLQSDKDLNVWAFVGAAENGYTKISKTFKVNRRNKPADYVFTPTDQMTLQTIQSQIGDLADLTTEAKDTLVAAINEIFQSGGAGSVDPAAIAQAVEDYMAANPIQETDPTVPAWAKRPEKPTYTAEEVHALPDTVNPIVSTDGNSQDGHLVVWDTDSSLVRDGGSFRDNLKQNIDSTLSQPGKAADAAAVGDELRSLSGKIASLPTAITRTFKTQAIGELFDQPESYTAWCSGSLHYDNNLCKFVDLLYAAPKHENPDYTVNYVTYIDPKTYEATAPVLCKYYDTDGITQLTITNAGRPAFVILRDGSYMMLQTIGSVNYRFLSTDYGLTWVKREQITGYSGSTETYALVQLSNGRILANATSNVINYSDDDGETWTSVTPVTSGASYEAEYCFLEVREGIILGICRKTIQGIGRTESGEAEHAVITVSRDYGTTWDDLKISETIDNMNASTCTGYVHDGIVEIFAASRWYNNGDYAVTDYVNTGKSGAITHYVATIENALKDKFTKLGVTVYAKTTGNATTLAAQDFHTPCIAVNGDDMLMVYFDRIAPYNISDQVNHYYVRGSLVGIDYGVRDDLKSTVFPYSSVQIEKLLKKQYNELIVKINEAIMSGEVIPPGEGDPTSYILDGIVANFNFVDASKVDATAKTVTDTINGIVATCTSETFPSVRENSLGRAYYTIPSVSDYYGSTAVDKGFTVEVGIYRYDGDKWSAYEFWYSGSSPSVKYTITGDRSQASIYTYIDTSGTSQKKTFWWGSGSPMPIPSGTVGFVHIVATYDVSGTLTIYKNGEVLKTITPSDFSEWDATLVTATTGLKEAMKAYRIYNRALTAEEVASNYKYELSTIV